MQYEGTLYRPPSEARSLIIQATIGCAHNTCTFCNMYLGKRFRIRKTEEIIADIKEAASSRYASYIDRVFLADGDALVIPTESLLEILHAVKRLLPQVKRVTSYGTAQDVLRKTDEELKLLYENGLAMVYLGAESGDDEILKAVKKDMTADEMAEAGQKLKKSGILCSVTFISGLGGREMIESHAVKSALLTNRMQPAYASFLTLQIVEGTPMYEDLRSGRFQRITTEECVKEMQMYLSHVDSEGTVFRMNHASNCFRLSGTLNTDIPAMQKVLSEVESGERYARRMGEIEVL
ncbi:MAG: radical SAM protein [Lachnospiraceae bacterium]|nr:radical SAM protein [Lachnospiraceae bacterium]